MSVKAAPAGQNADLQPRWRAEGPQPAYLACGAEAEPALIVPWANMPLSAVDNISRGAAAQSSACCAEDSGGASQWRCRCSDLSRKWFGTGSLARERRQVQRAADKKLAVATKQLAGAAVAAQEQAPTQVGHPTKATGASFAVSAAAAMAAAEIKATVAMFRAIGAAQSRGPPNAAPPCRSSARMLPPQSAAQRAKAELASSRSNDQQGSSGAAAPESGQARCMESARAEGGTLSQRRASTRAAKPAAFPALPRRPVRVG